MTDDELTDEEAIDRYLLFLARRHAEGRPDLCPRCARYSIDPASIEGWCAACSVERQIEIDAKNEREKARKRRWWQENGSAWRAEGKAQARAAKEIEL